MKRLSIRHWLFAACVPCLFAGTVVAEQPARRFLDELRNRQYFDMAVEYLDRLADSATTPAELKETIDYETGITLVQLSESQPQDSKRQEQVLLTAQAKFNAFLSKHPQHALANVARARLGIVQANRAANRRQRALQPTLSKAEKEALHTEAIELYDDARQIYEDGRVAIRKQLEGMPKVYDAEVEPEKAKELAQLRNEYVAVRFRAAFVQFEKAMVAPPDSESRREWLADAEKRFDSINKDYPSRNNGLIILQSRLFLGRCNQEAGKLKEAISFYSEILEQKEETLADPVVRMIASECLMRAIECWIADEQNKFDAAIEKGEWWLGTQRPDEKNSRAWLGFKLSLANAYLGKSESVSGNEKTKAVAAARRLLNEVSKVSSPYQEQAQEQFVSLTKGNRSEDNGRTPPKNFADAMQQAKEVRSEHQVASATVKLLSKRLNTVTDDATREQMQAKVDDANQKLGSLRTTEIELLNSAIRMADDDATPEQIQDLQYWLAIYYYLLEDDYRASVLGEFIARRYSETRYGQHAARIALRSLNRIRQTDNEFAEDASARLANVATFLLDRWPNTEASNAAIEIIIRDSVASKDFDKAEEFLARLPNDSGRRGNAELLIGQSIWSEYTRQRKLVIDEDPSPELLAVKERALALLNAGIEHKRADGVSSSLVQAELSLVANYLDAGEFDRAIEILNDPKTGPRTLAEQGSGLIEGMERRTYLFAIQAYIGALSTSKDPAEPLANAMESMDALKKQLVGVPNGEQALIAEYVKLAQALQSQIAAAPPQTRNAISQGYEKLLERVASSTNNPTTLAWTAESLGKLGTAMTDPGGTISTRGQTLVRRATELYDQVLKMDGVSDQLQTILRLRVAIGKRDAGEHKEAIDEFVKLLSANEMQVHVQMEAARTYQQWGKNGDNTAYKKAIMGDHPIAVKGGKNLVWGWGKLTQVLSGNPKYRDLFHECRYNLALCRYEFAMQSGKTEKGKALQIAKNEIVLMSRFYPELGGPQRKEQYDALLKKIQRAIGEKPTGLQ